HSWRAPRLQSAGKRWGGALSCAAPPSMERRQQLAYVVIPRISVGPGIGRRLGGNDASGFRGDVIKRPVRVGRPAHRELGQREVAGHEGWGDDFRGSPITER